MHIAAEQAFPRLTEEAINLGATASAIISSNEIQVKDDLALLCNGEYKCPNYGLAAGCPPHVEGPVAFRQWQAQSQYSVTLKIELPVLVMFSDERKGVMQLLHQIVAAVEQKAVAIGFEQSRGFAGGSCKELFCEKHETCSVIAENQPCRFGASARPSLAGFGIDAISLMMLSGWSAPIAEKPNGSDESAISWLAGLIVLA